MPGPKVQREVGRVTKVGNALYMSLPPCIAEKAGLKRGDRVAMDCDGRTVFAVRVPFEELIRRRVPKQSDLLSEQVSEVR